MPIPSQRVLELEKEVKELKRKIYIIIEQLYHKAGIEIYIEEKSNGKGSIKSSSGKH